MQTRTLERTTDLFRRITKSEEDAVELRKLFKHEIEREVGNRIGANVEILMSKNNLSELRRDLLSFEVQMVSKFKNMITWMFVIWTGSLVAIYTLFHYFLK